MSRTLKKSKARKQKPNVRKTSASRRQLARRVVVLVATRKGAWLFHSDTARKKWRAAVHTFSATSSITWCSIRATDARC